MKKLLVSALILGSAVIVVPSVQAETTSTTAAEPAAQLWEQPGRRWGQQRRTRTYTRIVRSGFRTYRETYRVTYRPNGRQVTRLISRVRIR